jgi:hypothetical protein
MTTHSPLVFLSKEAKLALQDRTGLWGLMVHLARCILRRKPPDRTAEILQESVLQYLENTVLFLDEVLPTEITSLEATADRTTPAERLRFLRRPRPGHAGCHGWDSSHCCQYDRVSEPQ